MEIRHAPKHGSWRNMPETESSIPSRKCIDPHIDGKEIVAREVAAGEQNRNTNQSQIDGQFTTADARIPQKDFIRQSKPVEPLALLRE